MAMTTLGRIANFTNDDDDDDDSGAQGAIFPNAGTRKVLSSLGHWFLFFRLDGQIFDEIFYLLFSLVFRFRLGGFLHTF